MPLSNDQIVSTLHSQSKETSDYVLLHHPYMHMLEEKGRITSKTLGYEVRKPVIMNRTATGGFYTGFQTFNLDSAQDLDYYKWDIKSVYEPLAISGREMRANRGEEKLLDLVAEKFEATKDRLRNTFHASLIGDGTTGFEGIQKAISTSPTSGTYGGQDRTSALNAYARNLTRNVTLTSLNVQAEITEAQLPAVRGTDWPDCALAGPAAWKALHSSLTAIQRINDTAKKGRGGFRELEFNGMRVWFDGGFGGSTLTSTSLYIMHSKYWHLEMDSEANFVPLNPEGSMPVDQDAFFKVIIAEGALCCNAPFIQTVIYA